VARPEKIKPALKTAAGFTADNLEKEEGRRSGTAASPKISALRSLSSRWWFQVMDVGLVGFIVSECAPPPEGGTPCGGGFGVPAL